MSKYPNPVCAALDFQSWKQAGSFAESVLPYVGLFKVGLELFVAEGPGAMAAARALGREVFLDLKLYDIPNTVQGAARSAAQSGADLLSVHASGGAEMVAAAVRGVLGSATKILAVTVLTSLDDSTLQAMGVAGSAEEMVERLAGMALEAGAHGLVCSAHEVKRLRMLFGSAPLLVVPGIRPAASDPGDQKRVATPEEALAAGADILVIGRPLRDAPDPAQAAKLLADSLRR